ncbi:g protein-coupled receptor [Anaeramoeba flamelloides]|uniref:G protein-coupled receptor n=1 Tax=Anaeramoeba flamelloides TaxID=1746091 RepID=A0AAV7YMJ8_9EUKA|nr:g protein-coupled receptor [Anaeramoeba flamelloides]
MGNKPLHIISIIFLSLCLIGYFFLILVYIRPSSIKKLYRKLIVTLSIYDFLSTLLTVLPLGEGKACDFQAYALTFLSILPPFWSTIIALITFLSIVLKKKEKSLNRLYNKFHVIVLILSSIYCLVTIAKADERPIGTDWCVVDPRFMIPAYIWYWLSIIACLVLALVTISRIRTILLNTNSASKEARKKDIRKVQARTLVIPLVFVWCYLWPSINRAIQWAGKRPPLWLKYMHAINFSLSGSIYAFVFVFSIKQERDALKRILLCRSTKSALNEKIINSPSNYMESYSEGEFSSELDPHTNSDSDKEDYNPPYLIHSENYSDSENSSLLN